MLVLQNISYTHPNKDLLFSGIHLSISAGEKIALIGNNGTGKSTLLKLIAGELLTSEGKIMCNTLPYYIPQVFGQYNHLTIAQALRIEEKLDALRQILEGNISAKYFEILNEDWTIEARCKEALQYWQLDGLDLAQPMGLLSGGQKTKVFLAGVFIHEPQLVLMDEPGNHLDTRALELLHQFIRSSKMTLLVVSHNRKLLNQFDTICELSANGTKIYGGNYDFYREQKAIEQEALNQDILSTEKALRKAKEKQRETVERQQKLDARGKGKQEKAGMARIMMNTLRNSAEKSTSKLKSVHKEKTDGLAKDLKGLRTSLPETDRMKLGFDDSLLHKGKKLVAANNINYTYNEKTIWGKGLNIEINSGDRLVIRGNNGSGKTTLIKLLLGILEPSSGEIYRAVSRYVYIDQDYSLINNNLRVYEQAQKFNDSGLEEHEIKTRLNRFLFGKHDWDKHCSALSGGERMRLMLCCLTIGSQPPDIIILDEPTNNLDIQNIEILTDAIKEYKGTLIMVSHDEIFVEETGGQFVSLIIG